MGMETGCIGSGVVGASMWHVGLLFILICSFSNVHIIFCGSKNDWMCEKTWSKSTVSLSEAMAR